MEYFKMYHESGSEWEQITYKEALNTCLGVFRDNDMTRDMLTIPNWIDCVFSTIQVKDGTWTAMPGLVNLLPMDVAYDDEGNHIEQG